MNYRDHYATKVDATSQDQPIPGKEDVMVPNSAGGFSFAVDNWKRLERFLVLGSEGGTYYIKERELTIESAKAVEQCIKENGTRVVDTIVQISQEGRAPKNDPALFVLAMCAGLGDETTRKYALQKLNSVARTGTHLFHFAEYVEGFRGWGRSLRKAITNWYESKTVPEAVLQFIKYQQRDGWSHRDLLRLCHVKTSDSIRNSLYNWVVNPEDAERFAKLNKDSQLDQVRALDDLKKLDVSKSEDIEKACKLITSLRLPREVIPTEMLNSIEIWRALLQDMPMTAMVRNLGKMTNVGLLKAMSDETKLVVSRLTNADYIKKSRIHPLQILVALKTYQQGKGDKGKLTWTPVTKVVDALDKAFYASFKNVENTGKRTMLALDVSGSMGWSNIAGMPITPAEASAAMALITYATESNCMITAFSHEMVEVDLSNRQRLDDVMRKIQSINMGGTDCSLPMTYALKHKIPVDTFVIYTDNETWYGKIHPTQALQKYRKEMGINAKLVVVAMEGNNFSIADASDAGMLDIVGFDTATPQVISDFSKS